MKRGIILIWMIFGLGHGYVFSSSTNDSIVQVMQSIRNHNIHECELIGIDAHKSLQWNRFQFLLTNLSDSQFFELTFDSNAVLQAYAYEALIYRKNQDLLLKSLTLNRESNKSAIRKCGCLLTNINLIQYVARLALYSLKTEINPSLKLMCEEITYTPIQFDNQGKIQK